MTECPKCGTIIVNPLKTWSLVGRPSKKGERFKLTMGLIQCSDCERKFRVVLGREKITIKGLIKEVEGIEKGLKQTLGSLREKIEKLGNEKTHLLAEIDNLKKVGVEKTSALEGEIVSLRKEIESLKELLGRL